MAEEPNPKPSEPPTPPERKLRLVAANPKVTNKGVDPALLRWLNDPNWRRDNILQRGMERLGVRVDETIKGISPFTLICGPPGINKSREALRRLDGYSSQEEAKWLGTPKMERSERRTMMIEETEQEVFRPMFDRISGRVSHPKMHCKMYWSSYRREVFFLDDVSSLRDIRIQELLQQATDTGAKRMVQYNYKQVNLPDDRVPVKYQMRGSILVICNFNRKDAEDQTVMKDIFTQAVLDRVTAELHLSFETRPLLQYVVRNAFVRKKGGPSEQTSGLLRYVYGTENEAIDDEEDDSDEIGIGFKGEVDEACKRLNEVRDFFLVNYERALISFRTLRRITRDRFEHPKDWMDYAEDHLKPRPPSEGKDDGKSNPAFVERPDTGRR